VELKKKTIPWGGRQKKSYKKDTPRTGNKKKVDFGVYIKERIKAGEEGLRLRQGKMTRRGSETLPGWEQKTL